MEAQDFLEGQSPLVKLSDWIKEAEAGPCDPIAMVVATADGEWGADGRVVLCRGVDEKGLTFYTNYLSPKGEQIESNPKACAIFYWHHSLRQARAWGRCEKVSRETSVAYWRQRDRLSQVSQSISKQSKPVSSRQVLEDQVASVKNEYGEKEIPCPAHWGGYLLQVERLEFWMGREHRLHDRFLFHREGTSWKGQRLSP